MSAHCENSFINCKNNAFTRKGLAEFLQDYRRLTKYMTYANFIVEYHSRL